jgi:hypothetical protein
MVTRTAMVSPKTAVDLILSATEGVGMRSRVIGRVFVAILVGAWLSWQICAAGIATLATRSLDPRLLALAGSPSHPQVGALFAQQLLASNQAAVAADVARSIVAVDPTNDRAVRVLGLATEKLGQRERGAMIMRQAAALGWRDTPTQLWVLNDAAVRNDAVTVIQRADSLARRNRYGDLTRAIFLAAITEPGLRAAFVDSLGLKPMWRAAFFADVSQHLPATSAPAMEALFREMHAKGQAVSAIEWLSYINRLVDLGQAQHARRVWSQAFNIPSSRLADFPYDHNFVLAAAREVDTPVGPFEWMIDPNLFGTVTFSKEGLSIPADIVGGTMIASQVVILPPGSHVLTSGISGSPGAAAAGWTITCLPSNTELSRQLAGGADDELSSVAFDVPDAGCTAQRLALVSRDRLDARSVTIGNIRAR